MGVLSKCENIENNTFFGQKHLKKDRRSVPYEVP